MSRITAALFLLASLHAAAQQKLRTLEITGTIIGAAVDRPGEFYLLTGDGDILKLDREGEVIATARQPAAPTLFDPRDGARLFAWYRDAQEYRYYNPSLETVASYALNPAFAIEPWLVCPSGDHKLWILDAADRTLKKLNATHTETETEVAIDTALIKDISSVSALREYQGFLFALDPASGIYIFNSIGHHIRTLEVPGITAFNFLGEELYFLKDGSIRLFNLFTAETRGLMMPVRGHAVLLTDERMAVIRTGAADIFEFRP